MTVLNERTMRKLINNEQRNYPETHQYGKNYVIKT